MNESSRKNGRLFWEPWQAWSPGCLTLWKMMERLLVLRRMIRKRRKVPQWKLTVQLHLRNPWLLLSRDHPLPKLPLMVSLFPLYSHACILMKFVQDAQHCIVRTDVPTTTAMKVAHQPAYLRSFKLPTPKAGIAPKVTLALSELGISVSVTWHCLIFELLFSHGALYPFLLVTLLSLCLQEPTQNVRNAVEDNICPNQISQVFWPGAFQAWSYSVKWRMKLTITATVQKWRTKFEREI